MYRYQPPRHAVKIKPYQRVRKFDKRTNWFKKIYLWGALVLLSLGGLAYWLFFSASFRLEKIDMTEAKNFSNQDLATMAWAVAHQNKLWPTDNLWLFNKQQLIKQINDKYYLDNLKIKIRPPHKLIISFQEKNYGLIWQEDGKFYYINYQGDIILEKLEPTLNIALIFNRGLPQKEGRRIKIEEKYLRFANELNQAFGQQIKGLTERELFVDNELNTVKIQIKNGPVIKFNTEEPINRQLIKLETLRRLELSDGQVFNSKQYIDLRYGDRVFYK